jgi:UDP:flavonoid glycosyltransferase YjiC (YdhE family)
MRRSQNKTKASVAVLPHVGTAKSHLLRAIALGRLLEQNFHVTLILPSSSRDFVRRYFPQIPCKWIDWHYGHNDVLVPLLSEVVTQIAKTTLDLERILSSISAEVVIGIPGFHTSAICRALGIKHISILHGPWLLPEYHLPDLNAGEKAIISSWNTATDVTGVVLKIVAQVFGYRDEGYQSWLERETVWVSQDFVGIEYVRPRPSIGFLYTDYGGSNCEDLPSRCLSVTLGTALDGLRAESLRVLSGIGLPLVLVGGTVHGTFQKSRDVYYAPALAGTSLARISCVAVSHGGIGTVPVFAEVGVPQLFLPHDLDQAVNAMLATRSGYGRAINLEYWSRRTPFGRIRPPFARAELQNLLETALRGEPLRGERPKVNDGSLAQEAMSNALAMIS